MLSTLGRRAGVFLIAVVTAALVATVVPKADALQLQPQRPLGTFIPAHAHRVLPTRDAEADSLNWSGYTVLAAPGNPIREATTNYIVPGAGLLPPGFSSTWTGIGGYTTTELIQAGTEQDTLGGYYAWYEILPEAETVIDSGCSGDPTCAVAPGDSMHVAIRWVSGDLWHIDMIDYGKWSWSTELHYDSSFSSAEWVLEAPTVGVQSLLANVGTQSFLGGNTYGQGGQTRGISAGDPVLINLGIGLVNVATTSPLSYGDAFNVCAYKQSCAAP
jgi:peptidase A4-like protein